MSDDPMFGREPSASAHEAPPHARSGEDWWWWRRQHPRIHVGRAGEDGSQDQWMRLLNEVGSKKMAYLYNSALRHLKQTDARVTIAAVLLVLDQEREREDRKKQAATPSLDSWSYQIGRWRENAYLRVLDLIINPRTFLKCRYQIEDPARVAKAQALADTIRSWYPATYSTFNIATAVVADEQRIAELINLRFLPPQPPKPQPCQTTTASGNTPAEVHIER